MTAWLAGLGARGGPLVEAASRFLDAQGAPAESTRGKDALALLAKALDAHCDVESPSDEEDRVFVEGAGALLGVVLVDVLGGAGHAIRSDGTHRVQIGAHGHFDPFAAIEGALEADQPRAALAAAIRHAEAEARGEGPASRVVVALERELEARRPELVVRERLERYVRLDGGIEVDVGRVIDATEDQEQGAVTRAVEKLVGMLPGGEGTSDVSWEQAAPRLVPRLVGASFAAELLEAASGARGLALFPLGHDVRIALLVTYEDRARYLRSAELEGFHRPADEVLARAIVNLSTRSTKARFARLDTEAGPMVIARSGDGFDAARLLLPTLHDVLAPELGSPFVAAIPHRDTLLACASGPDTLVDALRTRALDDAARAPHAISREIFVVTASGLSAR